MSRLKNTNNGGAKGCGIKSARNSMNLRPFDKRHFLYGWEDMELKTKKIDCYKNHEFQATQLMRPVVHD